MSFLLFVRETTETVFLFCLYLDQEIVFTAEEPVFCLGLYARDWSNEKSEVIETFLRRTTRFVRNYHAVASRYAKPIFEKNTDRFAV